MRLQSYPRCKPSGVDCLGEVPEHWEVKRFRRLIARLDQGWSPNADSSPAEGEQWGVLKLSAARNGHFDPLENKGLDDVPDDLVLVTPQAGDLLISRSNTPDRVGDACLVLEDHPRFIVPDLLYRLKLRSEAASPGYICSFLLSLACRAQIEADARGSSGSMVKLGQGHLLSWLIMVPSLHEQRAITDFLNAQTAKLDTLVAKKRELIEKLKEKRTALISRTVTRGLPPEAAGAAGFDPHPKLKHSGIDWLGDVPGHWAVKQLKWAVTFQRGHDLPADERVDGPAPVVSSSGVSATHSVAKAKAPGIVTGRYGTIGQFYLITDDYWPLNTTLYSIDLRGNEVRFLRYALENLVPLFLLNAVKSAVPGIDRNDVHPVQTAVPCIDEQRAIANYLDRETAKIDALLAKIDAAIERLQEYRSALITAAVTGKIDVRSAGA